ncbi:MAG TPA: acyl carrier protein [Clostridiales bacterium]|nr:acyl carrier protein [Clostridia bacterium]HCY51146.1 acyl carrier protein [Clostridiales bacterium]
MTTFEKVRDMLAKQLNVPAESIKEDSKIVEDLKADSLDVVEMLMNLEDAYSVSIPDDEAVKIKTVGDVVEAIDKLNA